jgi:hypothetical protein
MKKLSEYNRDKGESSKPSIGYANVKCDDCDVEMYYDNPYVALASLPMQQSVVCPKCNKRDYKVL